MTEENTQAPDPNSALTPESIQAKADIMENNICKDIQKSDHDTLAQMKIKRSNTLNMVVEKAVSQVLFRFNIHPSILGEDFKGALVQTGDPAAKPVKITRILQASYMDQGNRQMDIVVASHMIVIQIQGVKPVFQKNETIAEIYFEHETHPGKFLPNGKIDFRELHKFPSVKRGDKLLFVTRPVHGKPGISFEGKLIPVQEPRLLDLTFHEEGVIKKDYRDESGVSLGYILEASKTGVVVCKKVDGTIRDIDVTDRIELNTIDFSIGNIGTELVSPVSMKIGTINDGFTIRTHGDMEVSCVDGGHVFTDQSAVVDQVRPGSTVQAKFSITVRSVMDSELVCDEGNVAIKNELRDAKVTAPTIEFKSSKAIMLNSTVETHAMDFQNVYYCGVNKIFLGRDLFEKRRAFLAERESVESKNQDVQEAIELIKEKLLGGMKKLASQISDQNLLNMFKLLIHSLQTFTFSDSFKILENLRATMNVMQIDQLKKTFQQLEKLSQTILDYKQQQQELNDSLNRIEAAINTIRITLTGKINPTATIQIYCNKRSMVDPIYEIKPTKKEGNEPISCTGSFHLDTGFKIQ